MPTSTITSLQNQRVKDAVKLRQRRQRQRQGRILIDGMRELTRALQAGVRVIEVFVCPPAQPSATARRLSDLLDKHQVPQLHVTRQIMAKLAFGRRSEGVLGVADVPLATLDQLRLPGRPLVAVLEGVEKPGNLGAVLRSADAAGVSAVVVADGGTDLYNPNAIRASLGTIFAVPVCAAPAVEVIGWLRDQHLNILATRVGAGPCYTQVSYDGPTAVVLGSEAAGLSAVWTADDVTPIQLPMLGVADSLNVSATAAVIFYEALRQRQE